MKALTASGIDIEKVRVIGHWTLHGERAHFSFLFPKEERFLYQVDDDKDKMRFRIEVFNSVDGSSRLMVVASWLRLVCSNGLVVTAMMDLRRQHRQQLQIEDVGSLLQQAIRDAETDKVIFALWESQRISHHALASWADADVRQKWGVKAAVRVLGNCVDWDTTSR